MSDVIKDEEEFDQDVFDSMLHGDFEEPEEVVEEEEITVDDTEDDNDEYQEDTDQEDESDEEEELDEAGDGELDEDSEAEDEDEEEDSLVEDYDSNESDGEDEANDEDSEDDAEDTDAEDEDDKDVDGDSEDPTDEEDDTDTEQSSDGKTEDTDGVDYKAFYDSVVNTEFVVNGKKVKGFSDPKKIIQSQQMAGGFSEKMAGFKQYRPFMGPLKERGMLDDPAKFDLAMNLIDGDKEAIKKHLESLSIDPIDLDMEEINYSGKPAVASQESIIIEDTMERAKALGIEDRVREVVGRDWDVDSFNEFISNDAVRNDLLNHIETGAYDAVQDKMVELSRLDFTGAYGSMKTIDKYRAAVVELQKEQPQAPVQKEVVDTPEPRKTATKASVDTEKAKIVKARQAEKYKAKAKKREADITKERKRAASMSKPKPKAKPKPKFDPLALQGDELEAHLDFLISGGR